MALDLGLVGRLAARLFAMLEGEYEGRDVELRAALIAVDLGVRDADGDSWTHVRWHFAHAPDFDDKSSSMAYMAGVAAEVLEAAVTGSDEPDA